jgi:lysozyme family protein
MAEFEKAIGVVLEHEGGSRYVDHPDDPGGATRFGISLRFALRELARDADGDGRIDGDLDLDGDVDADDIRLLPEDLARESYRRCWWERYGYARLVDQQVATKVFDMAINMGGKQAHTLLQRALGACGYHLLEDGVLGPKTIAAALDAEPRELVLEVCFQQSEFYRGLVERKPRLEAFRRGWLARASWPFTPGAYVPDRRTA